MVTETDPDEWGSLRAVLVHRCASFSPKASIDDAIQEAMLAMFIAHQAGIAIVDPSAWCELVVRRRLADLRRRLQREVHGINLDALVVGCPSVGGWVSKLRDAGVGLTEQARELLERIESGYRGNRRLAQCLGRDGKTIRERRLRLQKVLRRLFERIHDAPPPLETTKCMKRSWLKDPAVLAFPRHHMDTGS